MPCYAVVYRGIVNYPVLYSGVLPFSVANHKPRSMLLYKSFPFWKEICAYSGPRLKANLFCVKTEITRYFTSMRNGKQSWLP